MAISAGQRQRISSLGASVRPRYHCDQFPTPIGARGDQPRLGGPSTISRKKAITAASSRKWLKLELALVLAEATGRRLGAIRQLSWDDIDLSARTIRWRAETDKKGKEWIVPIPSELCEELRSFRLKMGGAFGGLVFPRHNDSTQPLSHDAFGHWPRDAEAKAELPKLDGCLWHAYRRSWATSRKKLPVVDVAAAGGWSDVSTLLNCYQQADNETLLEVMSHSRKIRDEARTG